MEAGQVPQKIVPPFWSITWMQVKTHHDVGYNACVDEFFLPQALSHPFLSILMMSNYNRVVSNNLEKSQINICPFNRGFASLTFTL